MESDIREKKSQRFRGLELLHRLYTSVQRTKREKKSQNGDELSRQGGKAGDILICDTMPFRTDGGDILHGNNVANLTREKRTIFKLEWGKKKHVVFFFLFFPFNPIFSLASSPRVAIHTN